MSTTNDNCTRELTVELRNLIAEVRQLTGEMKFLKENTLPEILITHSVHTEKISRLELLVYGAVAAVCLEGLGIASMTIAWLLTR